MSDIFREVEEDLRREQLKRLWSRFGPYVVLVAVLIVVGTAGWRGWLWYSERQAQVAGERYEEALQVARDGAHDQAAVALGEIADGRGPFAGLARLRAAAEHASAGRTNEAIAAYDAVAADSGADVRLRAVARIRAGYLLVDSADQAELEQRLGELAGQGDTWRHSAREVLGLAAYRAGDMDGARERFEAILVDNEAPSNVRSRAQLMMTLIAADSPADAIMRSDTVDTGDAAAEEELPTNE